MKNIRWTSLLISACYVAAGVFFIINPNLTEEIICTWLGYGAIAIGVINIIKYFSRPARESFFRNDLMIGLMILTVGVLILVDSSKFVSVVYMLLGLIIMISGYIKLQDCVIAWRFGSPHRFLYLLLSVLSIGLGITIVMNPFKTQSVFHTAIGVGLIYSGISDFISAIFLSAIMIEMEKKIKDIVAKKKAEEEEKKAEEDKKEEIKEEAKDETILDDENKNPEV